jgi:hypothetical protein
MSIYYATLPLFLAVFQIFQGVFNTYLPLQILTLEHWKMGKRPPTTVLKLLSLTTVRHPRRHLADLG